MSAGVSSDHSQFNRFLTKEIYILFFHEADFLDSASFHFALNDLSSCTILCLQHSRFPKTKIWQQHRVSQKHLKKPVAKLFEIYGRFYLSKYPVVIPSLSVFSWLPPSPLSSHSRKWPSWTRVCSAGRRSRRPSCAVCSRDGIPARNNCNGTRYIIYRRHC